MKNDIINKILFLLMVFGCICVIIYGVVLMILIPTVPPTLFLLYPLTVVFLSYGLSILREYKNTEEKRRKQVDKYIGIGCIIFSSVTFLSGIVDTIMVISEFV